MTQLCPTTKTTHISLNMPGQIARPDTRSLLLPLLACLPTAFASSRPPPALLPLLSPILLQRVQLLSPSTTSDKESWIHLLCWDSDQASKLAEIIASEIFEPHPVSGEIELGEISDEKYRRLDEETLQTKIEVDELRIAVILLWCEDDNGCGGSGWRVSELMPADSISKGQKYPWWNSISEATSAFQASIEKPTSQLPETGPSTAIRSEDRDDDDDYWARYDNTPGRTPATKRSPAPRSGSGIVHTNGETRTTSEAEYFAQYAHVQPALDNHDPSEPQVQGAESTLRGDTIIAPIAPLVGDSEGTILIHQAPTSSRPALAGSIVHTRPSSSSSSLGVVNRLEESAAHQSHTEIAIQQHISTTMKSMFRLARQTGIGRKEFERLIKTELDVLSMMDDD